MAANTMPANVTLDEIERHAFITGDERTRELIQLSEDEFQGALSFDHQLVIDDRNRLAAAIEAILAVNEPNNLEELNLAILAAQEALEHVEDQGETTMRDVITAQESSLKDMNKRLNEVHHENAKLRRIKSMCQHLLRAFIGKHHPAWADALRKTLKDNA